MRKSIFMGIGAMLGALLAYMFDPDRGRTRRSRLSDQATARGRDLTEVVKKKVEYQKGALKGLVHEASESMRPEKKYDDDTLIHKIKSEALGYWDGSEPIEIDIRDGMVKVSGSVRDSASRDRLLRLIRKVEGVGLIDDRIKVGV